MRKVLYLSLAALMFIGVSCKRETQSEVAREGAVNFVTGDVFLITDGNKAKAKVGDAVKKGTTIETGAKSMVDIYFGVNVIKVLQKSTVRVDQLITQISTNAELTEFYVEKGTLFSKVARKLAKDETYKIKTPTTIAAVRGTEFLVSEEGKKGTVACVDGMVEVLNQSLSGEGAKVDVKEGKQVTVEEGKAMTVQELSESNRKMIQDILSNIKDLQADIRKKFEEEREKILKVVEDQKKMNEEMMKEQIEKDKKNVQDQKDLDKSNINKVLGDTDVKGVAGSAEGEKGKAADAVKAEADKQKDLFKDILPKTDQQ